MAQPPTEYYFTFKFLFLGIALELARYYRRFRMEEVAWERRLEVARRIKLQEDPTLTEIELRRKEAAVSWSAYGSKARRQRRQLIAVDFGRRAEAIGRDSNRRGSRNVHPLSPLSDSRSPDTQHRQFTMSPEQIWQLEQVFGVKYDPYYDDPYTEDELPDDIPHQVDYFYGDRIYDNGEIFYKDKTSGLFYRQGALPRRLAYEYRD